MTALRALLWDVDGTLAETERDGHRVAFNRAFETLGLPWRWDEAHYGDLLRVTGGWERLLHDMARRADAPPLACEREALARELHQLKNTFYAEIVGRGDLPLRPGVADLVAQAHAAGLRQAIVTTTSRSNVQALLAKHFGDDAERLFVLKVCGEDVAHKKPDPQAYHRALEQLQLSPLETLALEDSPSGATAAREAHVPVVVTRSVYFADAPIDSARAIGFGFDQPASWQPPPAGLNPVTRAITLADLQAWHASADTQSCFGGLG
jgi:HAD superfamily hydrolase (TIGR01509 family)